MKNEQTNNELSNWYARRNSFEFWGLVISLLVYVFVRVYKLGEFPITFFSDEAAQVTLAQNLLDTKFLSPILGYFPIYINAASGRWTPLLNLYFHLPVMTIFGKSVFLLRIVSVFMSLVAVVSVLDVLKTLRQKYYWLGALALSIAPTWFFHSRTALESVTAVALYSLFLALYLRYRSKQRKMIYFCVLAFFAAFYTYSNAQLVMGVFGILLFCIDIKYHLQSKKHLLMGLILGVVCLFPLYQFKTKVPSGMTDTLKFINSYLYDGKLSKKDKIIKMTQLYTQSQSVGYWFLNNPPDLSRHLIKGYGHLHILLLPFFCLGLFLTIIRTRLAAYRILLVMLFTSTLGGILAGIGINRVMFYVIPFTIVSCVGIDFVIRLGWRSSVQKFIAAVIFAVLLGGQLNLFWHSQNPASRFENDFGLYGYQWGARQIFENYLLNELANNPKNIYNISPEWANGIERYVDFYLSPAQKNQIRITSAKNHLVKKIPIQQKEYFVLTAPEYEEIKNSNKFKKINIVHQIFYPNQKPGFYILELEYKDDIDQILAQDDQKRTALETHTVKHKNEDLVVRHSKLDMGKIEQLFNGVGEDLIRGDNVNPFVLEIEFPKQIVLKKVQLRAQNQYLETKVIPDANQGLTQVKSHGQHEIIKFLSLIDEQKPIGAKKLRIEIRSLVHKEIANIHLNEIQLDY